MKKLTSTVLAKVLTAYARDPWLLAILSAVLQVLSFPVAAPLPVWRAAFVWVALLPLLLATVSVADTRSVWFFARLGYLCGVVWYMGNCYWIYQTMYLYGGLPRPVSFLILLLFALYLGLYHAVFVTLVAVCRRLGRSAALLLAPCFWVAVELARARITGFPWDLYGNSQVDNAVLTRIAPVTGVMGMSFVLVAFNCGLVFACLKPARTRVVALGLIAFCAVGLQSMGSIAQPAASTSTHVATLLQENLAVGVSDGDRPPASLSEELDLFSHLSLRPTRLGPAFAGGRIISSGLA